MSTGKCLYFGNWKLETDVNYSGVSLPKRRVMMSVLLPKGEL